MNATEYILNFKKNAFSHDELIRLISSDLGIKKEFLTGNSHKRVPYSENYFQQLKDGWQKARRTYVEITEREWKAGQGKGSEFTVVSPGHIRPPLNLTWSFEHHNTPPAKLFHDLISKPGFVFAYAAGIEDQFRQNQTHPGNYKVYRLEPIDVVYKGKPPHQEIDISMNPGRRTLVIDTWLTVTWKMWFGKPIQEYIPKELIMSFEGAHSINELDNGVMEVQLYEHPGDASQKESREIQEAFRQWIRLDNVIEDLKKKEDELHKQRPPGEVINIVIPPKKKPRQPLLKSIFQYLGFGIKADKPIPFGYKTTWIAVKAPDIKAITAQFKGMKFTRTNWKLGREKCMRGKLFISPPLSGGHLLVSPPLPAADSPAGVYKTGRLLRSLSKELGAALYFSSHRVSDCYAWVYAEKGNIKRAFSVADSEVTWDEGDKIGIEKDFLYPHESEKDPSVLKMDIPNEGMVLQVAADWCIDPTKLDRTPGGMELGMVEK